jgi:PIN domain nuclease of toxin-antitoxin system
LIAYLDTHIVLWLAAGKVNRLSSKARGLLGRSELLFSAMAYLELEYLHELGRTKFRAGDLLKKVEYETNASPLRPSLFSRRQRRPGREVDPRSL